MVNSAFYPFGECKLSTSLSGWVKVGAFMFVGWQVTVWFDLVWQVTFLWLYCSVMCFP